MMVFQQKLMIIMMIELGIWVIRATGNFIRSGPTVASGGGRGEGERREEEEEGGEGDTDS